MGTNDNILQMMELTNIILFV